MNDKKIIEIAQEQGFVVVTKDKDFLNYYLLNGFPPAILLLSIGNISNPKLTRRISENFEKIEAAFQSGSHLIILETERLVIW